MADKQNEEIKFEIINEIGVLSESGSWRLELNRISWNGREPKCDLRKWSVDHAKMGKGITFTDEELIVLQKLLTEEVAFL
ncbi:YdbC family protein [Bacillota bacterium Meth-B3]